MKPVSDSSMMFYIDNICCSSVQVQMLFKSSIISFLEVYLKKIQTLQDKVTDPNKNNLVLRSSCMISTETANDIRMIAARKYLHRSVNSSDQIIMNSVQYVFNARVKEQPLKSLKSSHFVRKINIKCTTMRTLELYLIASFFLKMLMKIRGISRIVERAIFNCILKLPYIGGILQFELFVGIIYGH